MWELTWWASALANQLTCTGGWRFAGEGERRVIHVHRDMTIAVKGGDALVISGGASAATVLVKAASEAELSVWHNALCALVYGLQQDGQVARLFLRERASLFSPQPSAEHPHMGSRNHRERAIAKTWYTAASAARKKGPLGARSARRPTRRFSSA